MKKTILFIMCLIVNAISYNACGYGSLNSQNMPTKSGTYKLISEDDNIFSDGSIKYIGASIVYNDWENEEFYQQHNIHCTITDIKRREVYDNYDEKIVMCYTNTIECEVSKKIQFYEDYIYFTTLSGYRNDGTLKWSRDKSGSTDISCYNKTGMSVVKRVNNPHYCK